MTRHRAINEAWATRNLVHADNKCRLELTIGSAMCGRNLPGTLGHFYRQQARL